MLDRLAAVFGAGNVAPFIFPDSALEPVDLLDAFLGAAGLEVDRATCQPPDPRANAAWDVRGLRILQEINALVPASANGRVSAERQMIEAAIAGTFSENVVGYAMPRAEAEAVLAAHEAFNRAIARAWFGRDTLFTASMETYERDRPEPSGQDYARVIAALARAASAAADAD